MKTLIYTFFVCLIFLSENGCAYAQNDIANQQAIKMLKEFYTAYLTAWSTLGASDVHDKKLYSLQKQYCTIEFRKNLKKWGLDQDPLINGEFTDVKHLNTLTITKDLTKPNFYIVSYVDHALSPSYKPIDKTVIVYVTIVKIAGSFKIANAYGDAVR